MTDPTVPPIVQHAADLLHQLHCPDDSACAHTPVPWYSAEMLQSVVASLSVINDILVDFQRTLTPLNTALHHIMVLGEEVNEFSRSDLPWSDPGAVADDHPVGAVPDQPGVGDDLAR